MRRRSINGRVLLVAAAITLGLVVGASAYWITAGSGHGSTTLGTPLNISFSGGTPTTQLSPGAGAGVDVTVSNPNRYGVHIGSLTLDTSAGTEGFDVDPGHASCDVSTLHFSPQSNGGSGWQVPAKVGSTNGSLPIDLPTALSMSAGAVDACQGATFTIHLLGR